MNDPKRILVVLLGLIVVVLGVLGIKNYMEDEGYKNQVRYTTAIQAETAKNFNYAVDTQQGNLLVNGVFSTDNKNLVKFEEMTQGFTFVERTKEHYTPHTHCSKNSCYTTYSWDAVSTDELKADKVQLYGREYNGQLFDFSNFLRDTDCKGITPDDTDHSFFSPKNGCYDREYYLDSDDRYVYRTVPTALTATFIANSLQGGLKPVSGDRIKVEDKSIKQVLHDVGQYKLVAFWVALIIIIILVGLAAYAAYTWVIDDGQWSLRE